MSDLQAHPGLYSCGGIREEAEQPRLELLRSQRLDPGRAHRGGNQAHVRRFLPGVHRRMVSSFCLIDRIGPVDVSTTPWLVPPHPHMGLRMLCYVLEGELEHRDSLGNVTVLEAGQLSLFDSGQGASHLERTPDGGSARLQALQLWLALPGRHRDRPPRFLHVERPAVLTLPGIRADVLIGNLAGVRSKLPTFLTVVAAVATVTAGAGQDSAAWLPLHPRCEYAVLPLAGDVTLDGQPLTDNGLYYLGWQRDGVDLASTTGGQFLVLGGEPFTDEFLMWWNLAATCHEHLVSARTLWSAHAPTFGRIEGWPERGPTPPMPLRRPEVTTPSKPARTTPVQTELSPEALEDPLN